MPKRVVLLLALFVHGIAAAEICAKLEFTELDSMSGDQLNAMRCRYRDDWLAMSSGFTPKTLHGSNLQWKTTTKCFAEMERMDRILTNKHNLTPTEIIKRCEKKS